MIKCASCNKEIAFPMYTEVLSDGTKEHYCSRSCAVMSTIPANLLNIGDQIMTLLEIVRKVEQDTIEMKAHIKSLQQQPSVSLPHPPHPPHHDTSDPTDEDMERWDREDREKDNADSR